MKQLINYLFALINITIMAACNTGTKNQTQDTKTDSTMSASIIETNVDYEIPGQIFKSFAAYKDAADVKLPVVLVIPEWWGVNDYTRSRVKQLAELGYFAMAVDMYGNGKTAETPDSAGAQAMPFYKDAQLAKKHFEAALQKVKTFAQADTARIATIGYCFGGGMALNMARLGENLKGIVSFHGSLNGHIPPAKKGTIIPAILVCHGEADSMVPAEEVAGFKKEMDHAGVDYTFIGYPGAKHAFTNPNATAVGEKYKIDIAYNEAADKASWEEMKKFLAHVLK